MVRWAERASGVVLRWRTGLRWSEGWRHEGKGVAHLDSLGRDPTPKREGWRDDRMDGDDGEERKRVRRDAFGDGDHKQATSGNLLKNKIKIERTYQ